MPTTILNDPTPKAKFAGASFFAKLKSKNQADASARLEKVSIQVQEITTDCSEASFDCEFNSPNLFAQNNADVPNLGKRQVKPQFVSLNFFDKN